MHAGSTVPDFEIMHHGALSIDDYLAEARHIEELYNRDIQKTRNSYESYFGFQVAGPISVHLVFETST